MGGSLKNSFYLLTPEQKKNKELLESFNKDAIREWISSLPTANPLYSAQLLYEFIGKVNALVMPIHRRLEVSEQLRPQFFIIKNSLVSPLIRTGFPKSEVEKKTFELLISIEKNLSVSYWIIARELTYRDIGWFQGKNSALAIQRTIRGLVGIVDSYHIMCLPVPAWVWIDLHSLYQLSVNVKKERAKVDDEENLSGHVTSPEDSYIQALLLSLAEPRGLIQREIQQIARLASELSPFVSVEKKWVPKQDQQCIIFLDEDRKPYFNTGGGEVKISNVYLNLMRLYDTVSKSNKFIKIYQQKLGTVDSYDDQPKVVPTDLLSYVFECWQGTCLKGDKLFKDRLDRHIVIGLGATHSLQSPSEEFRSKGVIATSFSERELSCHFSNEGILSIGSLVSFKVVDSPEPTRSLAIVKKISLPKLGEQLIFELELRAQRFFAVGYLGVNAHFDDVHQRALLYRVNDEEDENGEKTYILMDSFTHNDGDILRLFMEAENFPIVLKNKTIIGVAYWQFECRRIKEQEVVKGKKLSPFVRF